MKTKSQILSPITEPIQMYPHLPTNGVAASVGNNQQGEHCPYILPLKIQIKGGKKLSKMIMVLSLLCEESLTTCVVHRCLLLTWFFPFSVRILVTLPKGKPRAMTSVSEASLGSFLMWSTRDGGASSTFSFLLSLPLDVPSKISASSLISCTIEYNNKPNF